MSLSSRVILLGASSDIGKRLLQRLSTKPGTKVLAVSRKAVPDDVRLTTNVEWLDGIDLTTKQCLEILADKVAQKFTEPFSVIHSVGDFWVHRPLIETDFSDIMCMLHSQVVTLFGAARYLTPIMVRNGGGRIVAFSCNSVLYSYPDMSPFTASKAAVESFIKCYAHEHSEFGISACALALPTICTETVLKQKPNGDHDNYITPERLADIIVEQILPQGNEITGNVVKLFKYSHTFYHSSYYDRNPKIQ